MWVVTLRKFTVISKSQTHKQKQRATQNKEKRTKMFLMNIFVRSVLRDLCVNPSMCVARDVCTPYALSVAQRTTLAYKLRLLLLLYFSATPTQLQHTHTHACMHACTQKVAAAKYFQLVLKIIIIAGALVRCQQWNVMKFIYLYTKTVDIVVIKLIIPFSRAFYLHS